MMDGSYDPKDDLLPEDEHDGRPLWGFGIIVLMWVLLLLLVWYLLA